MTEYGPAPRVSGDPRVGRMVEARFEQADHVASSLERKANRLRKALGAAAYTASLVVQAAAEKRIILPRQVSKQDATRKMRIPRKSPIRTRVDGDNATAYVSVAAHYTAARTRGILHVYQQLGKSSELVRTHLKIKRPLLLGSGARRVVAYQDEKRLKIDRYAWLSAWSRRPDRGEQLRRHAVRLKDPQVQKMLILSPAATEKEEQVIKIFRSAALEAVLLG